MTYGSESECATHYTTAPLHRFYLTGFLYSGLFYKYFILQSACIESTQLQWVSCFRQINKKFFVLYWRSLLYGGHMTYKPSYDYYWEAVKECRALEYHHGDQTATRCRHQSGYYDHRGRHVIAVNRIVKLSMESSPYNSFNLPDREWTGSTRNELWSWWPDAGTTQKLAIERLYIAATMEWSSQRGVAYLSSLHGGICVGGGGAETWSQRQIESDTAAAEASQIYLCTPMFAG